VDGEISVEPIPGPYTKEWETWLQRVLTAQQRFVELDQLGTRHHPITPEELSEIRRIWLEENTN